MAFTRKALSANLVFGLLHGCLRSPTLTFSLPRLSPDLTGTLSICSLVIGEQFFRSTLLNIMMMLYFDFSINTSFAVESHEKAFLCQSPMRYPINLHLGICKKSKLILFYSWHFSGRVQRTAKKDCGACVLKHAWSHFFPL